MDYEKQRQVVVAVCGVSAEEFEPDGVTLKSPYLRALKLCDAHYLLIPPGTPPAEVQKRLDAADGLLLIGGGDVDPKRFGQGVHPETRIVPPERDETDFLAFELADRMNLPILGICRGCQVINVARGGTLIQHLENHRAAGHDVTHEVHCERNLPITHWPQTFSTNSAHHQAIDKLGDNLVVLARSGDNTVEACGDPTRPYLLAVQWHPERIVAQPIHRQIFSGFTAACRAWLLSRDHAKPNRTQAPIEG